MPCLFAVDEKIIKKNETISLYINTWKHILFKKFIYLDSLQV